MPNPIKRNLAELEAVAQAYASTIAVNSEEEGRDEEQEACAALLAALTVLASLVPREDVMTIATALAALVIQATPDHQQQGGAVSDLLRDMEGF